MNIYKTIRNWIIIFRMHSLVFILFPYLLGILVAVRHDGYDFDPVLPVFGFIPLLFNHLAANLLSDIQDYRHGFDRKADYFSGGLVRGWITIRQAIYIIISLYLLAIISGVYLLKELGIVMLPFFITGFLLGFFYSIGNRFAFKYNVTGEWFIFAGFGLLVPAYGYLITSGHISLTPLLFSLPMSFLIAAVQHGNNWIASLTPGTLEKSTSAYLLGPKYSRIYYRVMIALPYIIIVIMFYWQEQLGINVPGSMLIVFLSFPGFLILAVRVTKSELVLHHKRTYALDSLTAVLYIFFISLCCISLFIN